MSFLKGFVLLLRPVNCLMMGLAVIVGELIAYGNVFISLQTLLGFITSFTLTGASMVANDYWDRFVDKVNTPNRPIPSGLISEKIALVYAFILIVIGISTAILTNILCLAIAIVALSISLLYSFKGKETGLTGNFMVSACVALPLVYGGFLYKGFSWDFAGLWSLFFFALMAFLANTGREVTKSIVDVEGDRLRSVRSVALNYSEKTAVFGAISFYILSVGLSVFPWLLGFTSWFYLPFVILADAGFIASSLMLLRDGSKENAKKMKNMVLLWMMIGLLAFIAGSLRVGF